MLLLHLTNPSLLDKLNFAALPWFIDFSPLRVIITGLSELYDFYTTRVLGIWCVAIVLGWLMSFEESLGTLHSSISN